MNTIFEIEGARRAIPKFSAMLYAVAFIGLAVFGISPPEAKAETYVGELTIYPHNYGRCFTSSVLSDGSKLDISSNAALYEALGRPHSDDGSTFSVPNTLVPFPPSEIVKEHVEPPTDHEIQTYIETYKPTADDADGQSRWEKMLAAIDIADFDEAKKIVAEIRENDANFPTHPTIEHEDNRARIEAEYKAKVKAEEDARLNARKIPCINFVGKNPMDGDDGQPLQGRVAGEMMLIAASQCPQGWQNEASVTAVNQQLLWCKATTGSGVVSTLTQYLLYSGNTCPQNTLEADGRLLSIDANYDLYSLFATAYGGDGRVNFGLPSSQKIQLELLSLNPPPGVRFCVVTAGEYPSIKY